VNRLKPIVVTLMLALFAFASSHVLLEASGLIHEDGAHAHGPASSDSDHDLADGNCPATASRVEIQKPSDQGGADFTAVMALACVILQQADLEPQSSGESGSSPPPELDTTWQFSSRAALAARAPSFAS